jgi:hypothetical protein
MDNQTLFFREFFTETLYKVPDTQASNTKVTDNPAEISVSETIESKTLIFGDKRADLLLLFSYGSAEDFPPADKEFITKLLAALGLSWAKICWANTSTFNTLDQLLENFGGTRIVVFQSPCHLVPEDLENEKLTVLDGRKVIRTGTIVELEANIPRKKTLWKELQDMFGL